MVQEGNIKPVLDFLQRKFEQRPPRENASYSPQNLLSSLLDHLDEVKNTTSTPTHADPLSQNEYKQRVLAFVELDDLESYWGAEADNSTPISTPQYTLPVAQVSFSGWVKKYRVTIGIVSVVLVLFFIIPSETPQIEDNNTSKTARNNDTQNNTATQSVEYMGNNDFRFHDIEWQHEEHDKIKWAVNICTENNNCKLGSAVLEKKAKQDVVVHFPNIDFVYEKYAYFVIDWIGNDQVIKTDTIPCPPIEAK